MAISVGVSEFVSLAIPEAISVGVSEFVSLAIPEAISVGVSEIVFLARMILIWSYWAYFP